MCATVVRRGTASVTDLSICMSLDDLPEVAILKDRAYILQISMLVKEGHTLRHCRHMKVSKLPGDDGSGQTNPLPPCFQSDSGGGIASLATGAQIGPAAILLQEYSKCSRQAHGYLPSTVQVRFKGRCSICDVDVLDDEGKFTCETEILVARSVPSDVGVSKDTCGKIKELLHVNISLRLQYSIKTLLPGDDKFWNCQGMTVKKMLSGLACTETSCCQADNQSGMA